MLIPQPCEVSGDKGVSLHHGVVVKVSAPGPADHFAAEDLRDTLASRRVIRDSPDPFRLQIALLRLGDPQVAKLLSGSAVSFDDAMQPEGYVLLPTSHGLAVVAATAEAVYYCVQTLKQKVTGSGTSAQLHAAKVRDWPALAHRGMDNDLSRGPVPTLDYQKKQVRAIAVYKLSIYSPYFESTLAYVSTPLAAPPGGAMTRVDVAELVDLVKTLPKHRIAVPWVYDPQPKGFDRYILLFKQAGMESWVAPGVNNWNRVYPDVNLAMPNIQSFIRDGQRLGSTGAITTVWNDDGEGLFAANWYGILVGAAASWQQGESSIEKYQHSYGAVFHGDTTGKIDDAQIELAAAHQLLDKAGLENASDQLYWVDPWSVDGKIAAKKIRPVVHEFRLHAERALVLLAEAQSDQKLREPDALRAMELGARRINQIGMKFQLSDEIVSAYARAFADQKDPKMADDLTRELSDISDTNGRCQDIMNAYSTSRDLYEQAWLRENGTYWLHNVLARYDHSIDLWLSRAIRVNAVQSQWDREHMLPKAEELGIPSSLEN